MHCRQHVIVRYLGMPPVDSRVHVYDAHAMLLPAAVAADHGFAGGHIPGSPGPVHLPAQNLTLKVPSPPTGSMSSLSSMT